MKSLLASLAIQAAFAITLNEVKETPTKEDVETPSFDDLNKYLEEQQYQLVSYLGFQYDGPGVGEMFSSFDEEEMAQIKDDLELMIFHKWMLKHEQDSHEGETQDNESESAPKGHQLAQVGRWCGRGCGGCFPIRPFCGFGCGGCFTGYPTWGMGCGYGGYGGYGGCGGYAGYAGYGGYGGCDYGYLQQPYFNQVGCSSGICYGGSASPIYSSFGIGANPYGTDAWVSLGHREISGVNTYGSANVNRTNVTDINTIVNNVVRNNIIQRYIDAPGQQFSEYVNAGAAPCTPTGAQYC